MPGEDYNPEEQSVREPNIKETLLQHNWLQELRDQKFTGDIEIGTYLTGEFVEGMQAGYDILKSRNEIPENFNIPFVGYKQLAKTEEGLYEGAVTRQDGLVIFISTDHLAKASRSRVKEFRMQVDPRDNESVFYGRVKDEYFLEGVEEITHAADFQKGDLNTGYKDLDSAKSVAEYDSSDLEFHGLNVKIEAAKTRGMNADTLRILDERRVKALALRQKPAAAAAV